MFGRFMKNGWLALVVSMLGANTIAAPATPAAEPVAGPYEVIQRTSDALVGVIDEGKTYFETDPDRFYKEVYRVLDPVVDFKSFARGVMAVHAKRATPEQRSRFEETFKWGLVRTYGKALLEFDQEQVDVVKDDKPPRNPRQQSVRMEVRTEAGKIYPVDYSMALGKDGVWRMRNIVINGINIGLTYRNQFASAMQTEGDLDAVIDGWAQTVAKVDPVAGEQGDS